MIDLTLDSLTVPGIPDYTPPFGIQKDPLVSLSTVETNNNIIKPFTAQRAVEFSHDETLSRIERNAVLVFTGDADAVLDMSNVTTFKGNEIKIVNTTNRALTVKYLEVGEESYSTMNLTENSVTLTADSTTTYSVKVSVESESITTLWTGTKEQFDAIPVKDTNTLYNIVDDVDEELIQDEEISPLSTWSSEKIVERKAKLLKTEYYRIGKFLGNRSGFLLRGGSIKKMVAIGNSLTGIPTQYTLQDGTSVDESREYGATQSSKGWTNLVYSWLKSVFPETDLDFYKALVRPWEDGSLGQRDLSLIENQPTYKVSEQRTFNAQTTLGSVLDSSVDVIFVNAGENITGISDDEAVTSLHSDYKNLFESLQEKCPNAQIYVFGLWWESANKSKALISAAQDCRVQIMFNPAWTPHIEESRYKYSDLNHVPGDVYYKLNTNEELGSYTEGASANHPNDLGYLTRAVLVIYNLMWSQTTDDWRFHPTNFSTIEKPDYVSILNFNTSEIRNVAAMNAILESMRLPPGKYFCAFWYPYKTSETVSYGAAYVSAQVEELTTECYRVSLTPNIVPTAAMLKFVLVMQDSWIGKITLEQSLAAY